MLNKKNKGFTLIELLVVIAIIGVLSSVVLASLNSARKKARDTRRVADLKQMQLALELYFNDNRSYPLAFDATDMGTTYIATIPKDPLNSGVYTYKYGARQSDGTTACTTAAKDCMKYHIGAVLEENTNAALPGADSTLGFDGSSTDCAGTAGTDACYDVVE